MTTQLPADLVLDVYARVSREGDDRQRSTDGQVQDCKMRIEDLGAQVGKEHVDEGKSAWNPRVKRDDWDKLMARLESGATGGVVVFDLARFSRRPIEGERLIAAAERGLVVLDSESEYDLTTPNGKKAFRDHMNGAAHESDRLSRRVKRGKRLKARSGESNASSRPYGFKAKRVEKVVKKKDGRKKKVMVWDYTEQDEHEAAILRDLAARLLAGDDSQDAIVRELNAKGERTSTGAMWTTAAVRQLLQRPRNAGLIEYDGVVVAKLPGEPIFDQETWDRVCSIYAARRRGRPASDTYLCTGIARCGLCGHTLSGRPRHGRKPYPDGAPRREYWCQPRAHNGGCGRIAIDQRALDEHVAELVVTRLADPHHAAAVEVAARAAADQRQQLEAEIGECEELARVLAERLGRREISLARHDAAVAPLDRDLACLRERLAEVKALREAGPLPEQIAASEAEWQDRWDTGTATERRRLLRQALGGRRLVVASAADTSVAVADRVSVVSDTPPSP